MKFAELAKINVNEHIEKKNGFSYLSWAWAVDLMTRLDENSGWEYREWDGKPFLTLPDGTCIVYCAVTFNGKARTAHLPVMDHRNKPIQNPDAFQINVTMQRALVKAIALHGLGLYIYAGEDLPDGETTHAQKVVAANVKPLVGLDEHLDPTQVKKVDAAFSSMLDMFEAGYPIEKIYAVKEESNFDVQEQAYLWSKFDKKQKDALAKHGKQLRALHPATQA